MERRGRCWARIEGRRSSAQTTVSVNKEVAGTVSIAAFQGVSPGTSRPMVVVAGDRRFVDNRALLLASVETTGFDPQHTVKIRLVLRSLILPTPQYSRCGFTPGWGSGYFSRPPGSRGAGESIVSLSRFGANS